MDVLDAIERELVLPVPPARVWAALTEPDGLSAWFEGNTRGWQDELGELAAYMTALA